MSEESRKRKDERPAKEDDREDRQPDEPQDKQDHLSAKDLEEKSIHLSLDMAGTPITSYVPDPSESKKGDEDGSGGKEGDDGEDSASE